MLAIACGDRSDRPCTHRKSPDATIHLLGKGKRASLEGSFYRAVRVEARTLETNRATL